MQTAVPTAISHATRSSNRVHIAGHGLYKGMTQKRELFKVGPAVSCRDVLLSGVLRVAFCIRLTSKSSLLTAGRLGCKSFLACPHPLPGDTHAASCVASLWCYSAASQCSSFSAASVSHVFSRCWLHGRCCLISVGAILVKLAAFLSASHAVCSLAFVIPPGPALVFSTCIVTLCSW